VGLGLETRTGPRPHLPPPIPKRHAEIALQQGGGNLGFNSCLVVDFAKLQNDFEVHHKSRTKAISSSGEGYHDAKKIRNAT
jgi:hypothetical protein